MELNLHRVVATVGPRLLAAVLLAQLCACGDDDGPTSVADQCSETVISANALDSVPRLVSGRFPQLTEEAELAGWSEPVQAALVVEPDGTVCSSTVVESSGRDDMDEEVVQATLTWQYSPGTIEGEAVYFSVKPTFTWAR